MRDDLIEHLETVFGGCEADAHDLPHGLGVQVEAPPGCAPVRHTHQHHRGEILDLLQPEIVRTQPGFGRTPVEQVLRPRGCVLAEYDLGPRTPVGGEVGQRVQFLLGSRLQGRLLPELRNRRR